MSKILFLAAISIFSFAAQAAVTTTNIDDPSTWTLRIEQVSEGQEAPEIFSPEAYMNRDACINREVDGSLDINAIISLGEKIWQIVKDGAPVLEYKAMSVSAIPNGAICPFNMSGWSVPQSRTYKLTYSNMLGMDVITFDYKVIFSYGGKYLEKGSYLTNVSVHPADIYVAWGQSFNANVNMANILNVGTTDEPVAGIQVILEWEVSNPLNKFKSQRVYFVEGRGSVTEL